METVGIVRMSLDSYCDLWEKKISMYYTINQLAKMVKISADQLFQILLDCSHVCGKDGVYAVADSGQELGGIDCDLPRYEYGVLFPASLLEDLSVKEGIQDYKCVKH